MSGITQGILRKIPVIRLPRGLFGFAVYTACLLAAFTRLPAAAFHPEAKHFIFVIGFVALWRYSWGAINFTRSLVYRKIVFPRWRREIDERGHEMMPPKIYLLLTTYRIQAGITSKVISSAIEEAIACGTEVSIIASIVELADEFAYKEIFRSYDPPSHVKLHIVRIAGTGKRDGLAQGFKAISRDMPPPGSVAVVIDGDTVLTSGCLRKCVPFFQMQPGLGALTTDEIAEVNGTELMREWYDMRFAQRHLLMSSLSLSHRVMTLTGRMSMFRTEIVTNPDFIANMTNDQIEHWRLGRFRFLTGDDKSSLYWVLKNGYEQIYVPDVVVVTMEDPPTPNFIKASTQLMFRWFGNMLRTNMRILKLGPMRMPFFIWWAFFDQRISMWTSLTGPVFAVLGVVKFGPVFLLYYFVWVGFVRWVMAVMLLSARPVLSWRYPFLLYYNQVYGALIKTYVLFRLDRQSWTKQKTMLHRNLSSLIVRWNGFSSAAVHLTAIMAFVSVVGLLSGVFSFPFTALRTILN